jgi:hypothetical protein
MTAGKHLLRIDVQLGGEAEVAVSPLHELDVGHVR